MKALLSKAAEYARASPGEVGLIAVLSAAVLAASAYVVVRNAEPPAPQVKKVSAASAATEAEPKLLVHVAGAVNAPGVYELAHGSRVKDAIHAAGGPVEGADLNSLNLAAPVSDGEKVMVAKPGVVDETQAPEAAGGKVNLNTAGQPELEELPGVGPVTAQRILDYRRKKGRFTSVRQLLEVEGIGQKRYDALKDLVTV